MEEGCVTGLRWMTRRCGSMFTWLFISIYERKNVVKQQVQIILKDPLHILSLTPDPQGDDTEPADSKTNRYELSLLPTSINLQNKNLQPEGKKFFFYSSALFFSSILSLFLHFLLFTSEVKSLLLIAFAFTFFAFIFNCAVSAVSYRSFCIMQYVLVDVCFDCNDKWHYLSKMNYHKYCS